MNLQALIATLLAITALALAQATAVSTEAEPPAGCPDFTRKAIAFPTPLPIANAPVWVNALHDTNFNNDTSTTRTISVVKAASPTITPISASHGIVGARWKHPRRRAVVTMEAVGDPAQDVNGTLLLRRVDPDNGFGLGPQDGDLVSRNSAVLPGDKLVYVYNHYGLSGVMWERHYEYGSDMSYDDMKDMPPVPARCERQPYVEDKYRDYT
ncbi:hypothetical protein MBLNU457_3765t1 [Dothideomycetes sp. NU457]